MYKTLKDCYISSSENMFYVTTVYDVDKRDVEIEELPFTHLNDAVAYQLLKKSKNTIFLPL